MESKLSYAPFRLSFEMLLMLPENVQLFVVEIICGCVWTFSGSINNSSNDNLNGSYDSLDSIFSHQGYFRANGRWFNRHTNWYFASKKKHNKIWAVSFSTCSFEKYWLWLVDLKSTNCTINIFRIFNKNCWIYILVNLSILSLLKRNNETCVNIDPMDWFCRNHWYMHHCTSTDVYRM